VVDKQAALAAFAVRCRRLRRLMGWSQEHLGIRLDVTRYTVNRWEKMKGHLPAPGSMKRFIDLEHRATLNYGSSKE
jgi:transcriptional regulator with XRE-family HTH domain